jgi:hypothetical protein
LLLEQSDTTTAVVDPATSVPDWYADTELVGGKAENPRISNSTGQAPLTTAVGTPAMVVNYNVGDTSSVAAVRVRVRDASPLWNVPARDRTGP